MDPIRYIRSGVCTCAVCAALTVETVNFIFPIDCSIRNDVIVCGSFEAVMPDHGPHGTEISTPAFEQRDAVVVSGSGGRAVRRLQVGGALRVTDSVQLRMA